MATGKRKFDDEFPHDLGSNRVTTHVQKKMKQCVSPMIDSAELFQNKNSVALWQRFDADGYLLLRDVLDKRAVDEARNVVQAGLVALNLLSQDLTTVRSAAGWTIDTTSGTVISGAEDFATVDGKETRWLKIGQAPSVQANNVYLNIMAFFSLIYCI